MGCFNIMGFHSNLPIFSGEKIVYFFFVKEKKCRDDVFPLYTGSLAPISLPFIGRYNEYGGIEDVEETETVRIFKEKFGCEVEDLANVIAECGGQTLKDLEKLVTNDINMSDYNLYKHVLEVIKNDHHWVDEEGWPNGDTLALYFGVEHYEIYEKMATMTDQYTKDFEKAFDEFFDVFNDGSSVKVNIFNEHEHIYSFSNESKKLLKRIKESESEEEKTMILEKVKENMNFRNKLDPYVLNFALYSNLRDCCSAVLCLYDSVEFKPTLLRDDAKRFLSFHRMLSHLCSRYTSSQYGNQCVNDMKYQFLALNEVYASLINRMKTCKEMWDEDENE